MNYEQAVHRLANPRAQLQKKLGHKLLLYYEGSPDGLSKNILLRYFETDILTWYPDGGVRIAASGFWDSHFTREKIDTYSPRGWRMNVARPKFLPKHRVAYIHVRTDTWEHVRAMPYEDDTKFYEDGRADHKGSPLNDFDASSILGDIEETVDLTVHAFLHGELAPPTIDMCLTALEVQTMSGIVDRAMNRNRIIVEIAKSRAPSASLIWGVIDKEYRTSFRMNQLELYEPKAYSCTGKPKTEKERVAQMEHFLRVGHNRTRYLKNSEEYHAMRKDLLAECQEFLLRELGFQVKEYERRPRSPW